MYYAYQTELIALTSSLRFRQQKGHKIKRKASSLPTPIIFHCISTTLVTKKTRVTNKEAGLILWRIIISLAKTSIQHNTNNPTQQESIGRQLLQSFIPVYLAFSFHIFWLTRQNCKSYFHKEQVRQLAVLDVVLIAILKSFFTIRFICLYANVLSLSVRPKWWRACAIFFVHPFFSAALVF